MNHSDIAAARRLIAQFEGNALGRHNSSQLRDNPVAERPAPLPEQRHRIIVKDKPDDCAVGEYCWVQGDYAPEVTLMRFRPLPDPRRFIDFNSVPSMDEVMVTWEFERVWLVEWVPRRPRLRQAWHRIA